MTDPIREALERALGNSDNDISCHGCNVYYRGNRTEVIHGEGCWTIAARAALAAPA